jgi:hypothetical protein
MTLPYAFSNNTSPTGGQLDADLFAVAALGILDGTVTGTNAITFTQNSNQPVVSVYTNSQKFAFTAVANSTSSVTFQVAALAALPLYLPTGVQAGNGSISNGSYYVVVYLSALNTGAGGFLIISSIPASGVAPVLLGSAQGLLVKNDGSVPNTSVDITAKQAILQTTGGTPLILTGGTAPNVVVDLTTTGANGMSSDGARPTSGWVYLYLISTGSVTAGLGCITSPTSALPTFPGGYSYYLYVGAMFCDGSRNLMRTRQQGKRSQYVLTAASNTSSYPTIASGSSGTINSTTFVGTSTSVAAMVPATAGRISGNCYQQVGGAFTGVNPNNNCSGYGTTSPPLWCVQTAVGTYSVVVTTEFELESTTVYYASSSGGWALCTGWEDYYVNA